MVQRFAVLRALADGQFHSGQDLAAALGVSRTAIWKQVSALGEFGLRAEAVRGRGYRLARAIELLDADLIRGRLQSATAAALSRVEVLAETDSTNRHLLRQLDSGAIHAAACLAEFQHSGRGRRGKDWISPFGSGLCLSLAWQFDRSIDSLAALSLAAGVGAIRAVERLGIAGVGLKWPNDLSFEDRKLAGILTEVSGEAGGLCTVVIGIGLNIALPPDAAAAIPQSVTDLQTLAGGPVSRNQAAVVLLDELTAVFSGFDASGLRRLIEEWRRYDVLRNRSVTVHLPSQTVVGTGSGIDDSGALLVDCNGDMRRFIAGDVSVRPAG